MTFNSKMGCCVSAWRHHAGLSQESLARAIGISPTTLSKIENGKQSLTVEVLLELLSTVELTVCDVAEELPKPDSLGQKPLWERIDDE